jgi:RHH-type proline utilization regulon transcriptional repressor/proline dehydrogenase/delta 1-pyrroline-5-carboxylate dehydrogenase
VRDNPGISIGLSALFPRFEMAQADRVMAELVPRVRALVRAARAQGVGPTIDAEGADRLELSLDVIAAVLADAELAGWDGFGGAVQACNERAAAVTDRLRALAEAHDRRILLRLVRGADRDTGIRRAQVAGPADFPVWTREAATDVAYLCCARKLMAMSDRIYPQFATQDAHTVAAILELAGDRDTWEFARLHGMGEALHELARATQGGAAGSARRWARTRTCPPILCGTCARPGRSGASRIRGATATCRPRRSRTTRSRLWRMRAPRRWCGPRGSSARRA